MHAYGLEKETWQTNLPGRLMIIFLSWSMSNHKFRIQVDVNGKKYSMPVELTYESEQVQRFTLYGSDRKLLLEKRLKATGEKY